MSAIEVIGPATEQVIAEVPRAGAEEVDAEVARAQAFPAWGAVAPVERAKLLRLLADGIEERGEDLARLEARNAGGLSGSIWTRDGALRVARALEAGAISINSNTSVRVSTPFGGFKQSGVGRELGPEELHHYTDVKNVLYATEGG